LGSITGVVIKGGVESCGKPLYVAKCQQNYVGGS